MARGMVERDALGALRRSYFRHPVHPVLPMEVGKLGKFVSQFSPQLFFCFGFAFFFFFGLPNFPKILCSFLISPTLFSAFFFLVFQFFVIYFNQFAFDFHFCMPNYPLIFCSISISPTFFFAKCRLTNFFPFFFPTSPFP